ncbi:GNAT superfamily N-acetyltransferase [Janthinobacterium sp. CG_23.3]|uniref:GNAT family N-acetyltransferase n=1 Tax=Janthinobacterium sp. CG_23.3 TaxID=3349634 RepID=UPI0038D383D7
MMLNVTIRKAERCDVASFLGMVRALAAHEGFETYVLTSEEILARDGFGENPQFCVFLAEMDGKAVGFASYTVNYSIWNANRYLHVDDVFVDASARGGGVGKQLMKAVAGECRTRGLAFARWTVELGNAPAVGFYRGIGAAVREKGVCSWMPSEMDAFLASGV